MKDYRLFLKLVFLLTLSIQVSNLSAQGWIEAYGDTLNQFGEKIIVTPDQGYIFGGLQTTLPDNSEPFIYLVKTDGNGVEQWTELIPFGFDSSTGIDMLMNEAGNVTIMANDGSTTEAQTYLTEVNLTGSQLWDTIMPYHLEAMDLTIDGGYIFSGHTAEIERDFLLLKTDAFGNVEWEQLYNYNENDLPVDVLATSTGKYLMLGYVEENDTIQNYLLQVNGNGEEEWAQVLADTSEATIYRDFLENEAGDYILLGEHYANGYINLLIRKIDSSGNTIWINAKVEPGGQRFYAIDEAIDSGYVIGGNRNIPGIPDQLTQEIIYKLDDQGEIIWKFERPLSPANIKLRDVVALPWGSYLGLGFKGLLTFPDLTLSADLFAIALDSQGLLYDNHLRGKVVLDENEDCNTQPDELNLSGWLVHAIGLFPQYTYTDSLGNFDLTVDTGSYVLSVFPPNEYWTICANDIAITIDQPYTTINQDFLLQSTIDCPLLEISLSTGIVRPCRDSLQYTVHYSNQGTLPAIDAYVEVELNEWMEYVDASIPLTAQDGQVFTFYLDTVSVNEHSSFSIRYNTDCDSLILDQTVCSNARIYPDSICLPSIWDGPEVILDAECLEDSISFTITNIGEEMMEENYYVIIEDNIILLTEPFQLNAMESKVINILGSPNIAYHLFAEQSDNYPLYIGFPFTTVSILSCEDFIFGLNSSTFPQNDGSPFYDEDCRIVRLSFDPNDKTGFPFGLGDEHLIQKNMDLEYLIRFQNIGNDTAFNIVIRDTLSPFLDISTLKFGASSHPYTSNISANRALSFYFDNILLPDSTTNEPASHGWIKFNIAQKENNSIGTRIENTAAIFFDFNAPVFTNQTVHTIGEDLVDMPTILNEMDYPELRILITPNPMYQSTQIQVKNIPNQDMTFVLYDSAGHLIEKTPFKNNEFTFYKNSLFPGIYFFQILTEGNWLSAGKLIIQ